MDALTMKPIAIVLATILKMIIGMLWYSPLLFGKLWQREIGLRNEEIRSKRMPIPEAIVVSFVISWVLAKLILMTHAITFGEGACLGFWCWLGFVATTHFSGVLWTGKSLKVYAIDVAGLLVSFILAGGLIAVTPR